MTKEELDKIEKDLSEHGYKKWTNCLSANNDWEWFKGFHYSEETDQNDYQIGFRVWDWRKYGSAIPDEFGFDCAVLGYTDHRCDLTIGSPERLTIEQIEEIAEKHYNLWMENKLI